MLKDLIIDPACLGNTMYLASVTPSYKYDGNRQRTNEVEGYRYDVVLADKGFEKLGVKVLGEQQLQSPETGLLAVAFEGLQVKVYVISGELKLSAKASKITKAKN